MISKNKTAIAPIISQRRLDCRRPTSGPAVDSGPGPAVIGGAESGAVTAGGVDDGAEAGSMRGSPFSATLPSLAPTADRDLTIRQNPLLSIAPGAQNLARFWTSG